MKTGGSDQRSKLQDSLSSDVRCTFMPWRKPAEQILCRDNFEGRDTLVNTRKASISVPCILVTGGMMATAFFVIPF